VLILIPNLIIACLGEVNLIVGSRFSCPWGLYNINLLGGEEKNIGEFLLS